MPTLHIYSNLKPKDKASFAYEASNIIVATLSAKLSAVKILLHEMQQNGMAVAGVVDNAHEVAIFCELLILEGRSKDQHRACVMQITKAIASHFACQESSVSIYLHEMAKTNYSHGGVFVADA